MDVNLVDLRNVKSKAEAKKLIAKNVAPIVILLGHGNRDSFMGFSESMLRSIPNAKIVWIYACECGLSLINRIAPGYVCVLGYATEVLAQETGESTVAHRLRQILQTYSGEMDPEKIIIIVQEGLLNHAMSILSLARKKGEENGWYLVQAALVNHTRLSLRKVVA